MDKNFDFSGWATRNDLICSDGRTIHKDAFKENDGQKVPLVWNHQHNDPLNVLGHATLENRDEGVYAYCKFNNTESGTNAKLIVEHGDVSALSIYANQLKQQGSNVLHGTIREVSLVLAGANPGAFIDSIIRHGETSEEEAIIYTGKKIELYHASDDKQEDENGEGASKKDDAKNSKEEKPKSEKKDEETVADVFNTLNEKQKTVVYALVGQALENNDEFEDTEKKDEPNKEDKTMKHNVFDKDDKRDVNVLSHSDIKAIFTDAKRCGSLRDAVAQHEVSEDDLAHSVTDAGGNTVNYGIANIDYLFPDAKAISNVPDFISRDMDWVAKVMAAKHLPFSRVKSLHANITMDEARAKGYIKGNQKANEVFALLKRTTSPTTIYKKQKLDRDDIVDIVDFDIVAWLKGEMRMMLNEEIARAALVGDGRTAGTDDKISEDNIRPIWTDNATYTIRKSITVPANATDDDKAKAFIRAAIKSRKDYKGSGNPTLFTTEDMLTDCLLMEDGNGRVIYETVDKLKTALRVSDIVTVPVMEDLSREGSGTDAGYNFGLMGIIVNMSDYGFGADKGGAVNMFDDFDIDFNQQKYLIETRCSGALMKPYSAIVLELKTASSAG
jgi:HK97 family phage prohead protease